MKKKLPLSSLILAGITAGLLSSHLLAKEAKSDLLKLAEESNGNITYVPLTEEELLLQLNDEGTKLYMSLSPEGKALARETASRKCNGNNSCKGLNACRTDKNECAGKGTCKGTTKCAISDPNFAVKLAAKKMAEKREELQKPSNKK